jgi:DNA ligase-1
MIKKILCLVALVSCLSLANGYSLELMLPLVYEEGLDLSGWLMSEKLDGVRACWDGEKLLSKNGIPFNPPRSFTENFPDFAVEGELWGGRGTFEKTVSIVMQKDAHIGWHELKLAIFDVPGKQGGFEDRLNSAKMWFAKHPSEFAFVIKHKPVTSADYLQNELKMIEEVGGEGIILRKSGSLYIAGRSKDVLKLKSYADMEALIVGHLGGEGRNAGRLGALLVEIPRNKTRFKIGTGFSDAVRDNPPPVGTVITFKYYGFYQSGVPRFPSYLHENFNYE